MTAKRRRWLFVLAGAAIAFALMAVLYGEHEPSYQGRSLSRWVAVYATTELDSAPSEQTSRTAMQYFGTNALPFLLKWVRYESPKSGVKTTLRSLVRKLPDGITPDALESWGYNDKNAVRAECAAAAFELLEDQAQLVIPELAQLMNDSTLPIASQRAVVALGYIGQDACPVLLAQLGNPNAPHRPDVANILGVSPKLTANPDTVIPVLVRCLEDSDLRVREISARSLGRIAERSRSHAAMAVPALTNCLGAANQPVLRNNATWALGNYGDQARTAVPILLQAITDSEERVRIRATNALLRIAPEALTNGILK